jgi:hypothetical protein
MVIEMGTRILVLLAVLTTAATVASAQTSESISDTFRIPTTYAFVPFDSNLVMMAPTPATILVVAAGSVLGADGGDGISDGFVAGLRGECDETRFH